MLLYDIIYTYGLYLYNYAMQITEIRYTKCIKEQYKNEIIIKYIESIVVGLITFKLTISDEQGFQSRV